MTGLLHLRIAKHEAAETELSGSQFVTKRSLENSTSPCRIRLLTPFQIHTVLPERPDSPGLLQVIRIDEDGVAQAQPFDLGTLRGSPPSVGAKRVSGVSPSPAGATAWSCSLRLPNRAIPYALRLASPGDGASAAGIKPSIARSWNRDRAASAK